MQDFSELRNKNIKVQDGYTIIQNPLETLYPFEIFYLSEFMSIPEGKLYEVLSDIEELQTEHCPTRRIVKELREKGLALAAEDPYRKPYIDSSLRLFFGVHLNTPDQQH